MTMGSGEVNALEAANVTSFIAPTQLNLGITDFSVTNWSTKGTFEISNQNSSAQTFHIRKNNLADGISINLSDTTASLGPGEKKAIEMNLNVDNSTFINSQFPGLFEDGFLTIEGTIDTLRIPWSFISAASLTMDFPQDSFPLVYLFAQDRWSNTNVRFTEDGTKASALVPPGTYDLFFLFGDWTKIVARENVAIEKSINLTVTSAEAKHTVSLTSTDENDQSLPEAQDQSTGFIMSKQSETFKNGFGIIYGNVLDSLLISDLSERYAVISNNVFRYDKGTSELAYATHFPKQVGLNSDISLESGGSDLIPVNIDLRMPGGYGEHEMIMFNNVVWGLRDYGSFGGFGSSGSIYSDGSSWKGRLFTNHVDTTDYLLGMSLYVRKEVGEDSSFYLQSPRVQLYGNQSGFFPGKYPIPGQQLADNDERLLLGGGLPFYGMYDGLRYQESLWNLWASGPGMENAYYQNAITTIIITDSLGNEIVNTPLYDKDPDYQLDPGKYTFTYKGIGFSRKGDSFPFELVANTSIERVSSEPHAPNFAAIQLLDSDGQQVRRLVKENGTIHVTMHGRYSDDTVSVQAQYRLKGNSDFISIPVSPVASDDVLHAFQFNLNDLEGVYDLRISATDQNDHSSTLTLYGGLEVSDGTEPEIVGQDSIVLARREPYVLTVSDFDILDLDTPADSMVLVVNGDQVSNAIVQDSLIMPNDAFQGVLSVPVQVFDGETYSDFYNAEIEVRNDVPKIVGQDTIIKISGTAFALELDHLIVEDKDDDYPGIFWLQVFEDSTEHYTISSEILTDITYHDTLVARVAVFDGLDYSDPFDVKVKMLSPIPKVVGQNEIIGYRNEPLVIDQSDLEIQDPDNNNWTVNLIDGDNYSVQGNSAVVDSRYIGELFVNLKVNDGMFESELYTINLLVENHPPSIVNATPIIINDDETVPMTLDMLEVQDLDDEYPTHFELLVEPGEGFVMENGALVPQQIGNWTVTVEVSDGFDKSEPYTFDLTVIKGAEEDRYVYPNPVNKELYVSMPITDSDKRVTISNTNGKIFFQSDFSGDQSAQIVPVEVLPPGHYIITIESTDMETLVNRFFKAD